MGGALDELGKKLAERWLSLLVLPGALFLAVAIAARVLGHTRPFDIARLTRQITDWIKMPVVTTAAGQVVALAAVLAGAAAVGLAAQGLGSMVERLALAANWRAWLPPLRQLARCRVDSRKTRWSTAHDNYHQHYELAHQVRSIGGRLDSSERHKAYRARARIALELPDRPTWSGDRIHASAARLERDHYLHLATVWPYLWLILPEAARTQITSARQALTRATAMGSWALLYAVLTVWWWPAALLATILAVVSWYRTRAASDTYAQLLEATARIYARDLARQVGIDHPGPLDPRTGHDLTRLLYTEPPPPQ